MVNAKRWKIEIVTSHVNGEMGGKNWLKSMERTVAVGRTSLLGD